MKTLVTGLNGSGKSAFAENLMDDVSYNYFATLEPTTKNRVRIERHKKRRDGSTVVHEATGVVEQDLVVIQEFLSTGKSFLLDGLTIYILRLITSASGNKQLWLKLSTEFIDGLCSLLAYSHNHWVMVDICRHGLKRVGPDVVSLNKHAHEQLSNLRGTQHIHFCAKCEARSMHSFT
jgi:adenosyl cobinamide kinase/adenosyl cobinamide phosphate guanylyltransferase